jgi:hypothetical protein
MIHMVLPLQGQALWRLLCTENGLLPPLIAWLQAPFSFKAGSSCLMHI